MCACNVVCAVPWLIECRVAESFMLWRKSWQSFNIQVEEELAAYVEDEMLDDEDSSSARNDRNVSKEASCVVEQNNKRQKACPGQQRRVVTVTQWDASARKQMIRQLGQRGVT